MVSKSKYKTYTCLLTQDIHDLMLEVSKMEQRSQSFLVREALTKFLTEYLKSKKQEVNS